MTDHYWLSREIDDRKVRLQRMAEQRSLVHAALVGQPRRSAYHHALYTLGHGLIILGQRLQGELAASTPEPLPPPKPSAYKP